MGRGASRHSRASKDIIRLSFAISVPSRRGPSTRHPARRVDREAGSINLAGGRSIRPRGRGLSGVEELPAAVASMPRRSRRAGRPVERWPPSRACSGSPRATPITRHDPMLSPIRPTDAQLRDLLALSRGLPMSYTDVGATSGAAARRLRPRPPPGPARRGAAGLRPGVPGVPRLDYVRPWLDRGLAAERPDRGRGGRGRRGAGFAVWAAFTCRVIRVGEDRGPVESLGFTYGTLPGHLLAGEERFEVGWDRRDGSVWFDILADSRPAGLLGHVAIPDPEGPETVRRPRCGRWSVRREQENENHCCVPASPGTGLTYRQLTALAGGLVWATAIGVLRPGWPEAMLLLASLVVVPLGLDLLAPRAARPSRTTLERRARAPGPGGVGPGRVVRPPARGRAAAARPPVAGDHRGAAALRGLGRLRAPAPYAAGLSLGVGPVVPRCWRGVALHCEGRPFPLSFPMLNRSDDRRPLPLRRVRPAGAGGACRRGDRRAGGGGRLPRGGRGGSARRGRDHRRATDAGPPAAPRRGSSWSPRG